MPSGLICRYCGVSFSSGGTGCNNNPNGTKNHVAVSDGKHCIWCGTPGSMSPSFLSQPCPKSPSKKHQLYI